MKRLIHRGMLLVVLGLASSLSGQNAGTMTYAAASTSKFVNLPGLPSCMTVAVQRGDPTKEASVLLVKFTAGCMVPWHWHTAAEHVMLVSGKGKAEMRGSTPLELKPADYVYLPAKSVHQFTAVTAVTMFDLPDGAFDIHYVDAADKEIPPDQALKPAAKKTTKPAKAQ